MHEQDEARHSRPQMRALLTKVANHGVYQHQRGNMGTLAAVLGKIVRTAKSPSEAQRAFEALAADALVLLRIAAQFKRDGYTEAAEMLIETLHDPGKIIPGEDISGIQTVPVKLIMFQTEKTFVFIDWIMRNCWLELKNPRSDIAAARNTRLLEAFPRIHHYMLSGNHLKYDPSTHSWFGYGLHQGYLDGLGLPQGFRQFDAAPGVCSLSLSSSHIPHGYQHMTGEGGYRVAVFSIRDFPVAKKLCNTTTWTFDIPRSWFIRNKEHYSLSVALHPETEHADWQWEFPGYASRDTAAGMGALLIPNAPPKDHLIHDGCLSMDKPELPFRCILSGHFAKKELQESGIL